MDATLENFRNQLRGFTMIQLKEIAKTYGVNNSGNIRKNKLIGMIVEKMYFLMHHQPLG